MYEKVIMGEDKYDRYETCWYTDINIIKAKKEKRREEKSKKQKVNVQKKTGLVD